MNGTDAGAGFPSATLMERVDEVCDRFEHAWKAGQRPRIEDYIGDEAEPARSALLHELLAAELEWRRRLGERPGPPEYLGRLASHAAIVAAAFEGDGGSRTGPSPAGGRPAEIPAGPDATASHPTSGPRGISVDAGQRYRVLRRYAEGGLGVIYLAHDAELNREVALKEIQPRAAARPGSCARFLLEAEVTGRLEHPGIVPVYSLGQHPDGRPFYAMRLIRGTSLKEAIAEFHRQADGKPDPGARPLALRKLLDRFRAVCEAVEYAHSRGVLHRDVKPHNIMIGHYGETHLVDWGLAKVTGGADADPDSEVQTPGSTAGEVSDGTVAGVAVGTPAYMSPEQAEGRPDRIGPASDVYGLGATLFHLLTGRAAFEGPGDDVLEKVRRGDFPAPRSVRREVPRALGAICLKAMALEPEGRYATARDLADDVERWLADEPVSAYREPWHARARRWARRHRILVTAAAAAFLLTATVLGGCVLLYCVDKIQVM